MLGTGLFLILNKYEGETKVYFQMNGIFVKLPDSLKMYSHGILSCLKTLRLTEGKNKHTRQCYVCIVSEKLNTFISSKIGDRFSSKH